MVEHTDRNETDILPIDACSAHRKTINGVANWISNIDDESLDSDSDYDAFEVMASAMLLQAVEVYGSRPDGCEMIMGGDDDHFECNRCSFERFTGIADY